MYPWLSSLKLQSKLSVLIGLVLLLTVIVIAVNLYHLMDTQEKVSAALDLAERLNQNHEVYNAVTNMRVAYYASDYEGQEAEYYQHQRYSEQVSEYIRSHFSLAENDEETQAIQDMLLAKQTYDDRFQQHDLATDELAGILLGDNPQPAGTTSGDTQEEDLEEEIEEDEEDEEEEQIAPTGVSETDVEEGDEESEDEEEGSDLPPEQTFANLEDAWQKLQASILRMTDLLNAAREQMRTTIQNSLWTGAVIALIALGLSVLFTLLASGIIIRQVILVIVRLSHEVKAMPTDNFDPAALHKLSTRPDELGELAQALAGAAQSARQRQQEKRAVIAELEHKLERLQRPS